MNLIYMLLPFALLLGFGFLAAFIWSVKTGQFDDLETPAHRMLFDSSGRDEKLVHALELPQQPLPIQQMKKGEV